MSPAADERDRIRAAMRRILDGEPQRSNGALTVVALALEAEVPRNALTQRHPDLKNAFYELVRERGATPQIEAQLRATVTKLKKTIANKNSELARFKNDFPALLRAVNQLTLENHQLREALANSHGVVVPFPRQPPTVDNSD